MAEYETAATSPLLESAGTSEDDLVVERRRLQRTVIRHPAKVAAGDDTVHHCVVRNVTGFGVCIELGFAAERLPKDMAFSFDKFRTTRACKVTWREGNFAGIEFVVAEELPVIRNDAVLNARFRLLKRLTRA
ncbi:MAG: hypothetical protein M3N50_07285 [Pseudomonadota bacterium]|nr:hypothetical protein [Pseudomonadota bacterium]